MWLPWIANGYAPWGDRPSGRSGLYPLQVDIVELLPALIVSAAMAELVPGVKISIGSSSVSASMLILSVLMDGLSLDTLLVTGLALRCQLCVHVLMRLNTDMVFFAHSVK